MVIYQDDLPIWRQSDNRNSDTLTRSTVDSTAGASMCRARQPKSDIAYTQRASIYDSTYHVPKMQSTVWHQIFHSVNKKQVMQINYIIIIIISGKHH